MSSPANSTADLQLIGVIKIKEQTLKYAQYQDGQENMISELVWNVFSEFEAPDYTEEGINTFKDFINPVRLIDKIKNEGFKVYCCFDKSEIVGVIALRNVTHISLLFVEKNYHKRGIAKELLKISVNDIKKSNLEAGELTVNSSPYAVKIYEKLGFVFTDTMQEKDGIKYTPMKKSLY